MEKEEALSTVGVWTCPETGSVTTRTVFLPEDVGIDDVDWRCDEERLQYIISAQERR